MSDYKRIVSYIYDYQDGVKKSNVGFARVEARNDQCKITIHLKAPSLNNNTLKAYMFYRKNDVIIPIFIENITVRNGIGGFKGITREDSIMNSSKSLDQMGGIIVYYNNDKYYATQWDDKPIILHNFTFDPEALRDVIAKQEEETIEINEDMVASEMDSKKGTIKNTIKDYIKDMIDSNKKEESKDIGEGKEIVKKAADEITKDERKEENRVSNKESKDTVKETKEEFKIKENSREEMKDHLMAKDNKRKDVGDKDIEKEIIDETKVVEEKSKENELKEEKKDAVKEEAKEESKKDVKEKENHSKNIVEIVKEKEDHNKDIVEIVKEKEERNQDTIEIVRENRNENIPHEVVEKLSEESPKEENLKKENESIGKAAKEKNKNKMQEVAKEETTKKKEINYIEKDMAGGKKEEKDSKEYNEDVETLEKQETLSPVAARIFSRYTKMFPFEDNEILECVRMEPQDIGVLPIENWVLGNNSFLLHGYYNYRHLIFARKNTLNGNQYIIGVPGVFQNREQFMAKLFGFEEFKPTGGRKEPEQGEFGYWYTTVNI